ncbi:MAG: DUF1203 domain-containing protein [Pseudomonadota bacterium]
MTYRIRGLDPEIFAQQFMMTDAELKMIRSRRVTAGKTGRYPCRVSLEDAPEGDALVLAHYTNHDVDTPYRNAFAVYARKDAHQPAEYIDEMPPILRARPIALRCYDAEGNLHRAGLSLQDDVDAVAREFLKDPTIAYIDAHNAMHGCFAARIERYDDAA